MSIDVPVSADPHVAPPDGMAKFLASRLPPAEKAAAIEEPAAEIEPAPVAAVEAAPVEVKPDADVVLDPETDEPIANPTRNDRRIAKLWKREQAALAEVERLTALIETRNAAPSIDATQTAGRPENTPATSSDDALTAAAKARLRKMPTEEEVGKTYATYVEYVIDAGKWGGELAIEKQRLLDQHAEVVKHAATAQQEFSANYTEQSKLYPDFSEKVVGSTLDLGPVISDVIKHTPTMAGHLTYWAATHESDVTRIKALPPGLQLVEMGKVMAGLTVPSAKAESTPKNLSRAPAPTGEIGRPAGRASTRLEDAKNLTEFTARREAQLAERRRAQR